MGLASILSAVDALNQQRQLLLVTSAAVFATSCSLEDIGLAAYLGGPRLCRLLTRNALHV